MEKVESMATLFVLQGGIKVGMFPPTLPQSGQHSAPYVKFLFKKEKSVSITILDSRVRFNDGFSLSELNKFKTWVTANREELLKTWSAYRKSGDITFTPKVEVLAAVLEVIGFKILGDRVLRLEFSNGEVRTLDFKPLLSDLTEPIYRPLHDPETFKKVRLEEGTIVWDQYLGFDPDILIDVSQPESVAASAT